MTIRAWHNIYRELRVARRDAKSAGRRFGFNDLQMTIDQSAAGDSFCEFPMQFALAKALDLYDESYLALMPVRAEALRNSFRIPPRTWMESVMKFSAKAHAMRRCLDAIDALGFSTFTGNPSSTPQTSYPPDARFGAAGE